MSKPHSNAYHDDVLTTTLLQRTERYGVRHDIPMGAGDQTTNP